ncbi:hypothetical protein [Kitasatospora aureofaciens]|uniref:hypothetical protein n=1 Tax=Kitasatospora aureofaciens TaxID=1894 RepID=UPI0004CA15F4|nr:hypothetical protein [Kitasatospora aureofaciens]
MNEPDVDGRTLSAAFERTMDGVGPDLGPLVAASARQGRSIRRRRRLTVAGAVTAVAALAVGGAVTLRTDDGAGNGGQAAAAASTAGSPTASPTAPASGRRYPRPVELTDDSPEQPTQGTGPNAGKVAMTAHAALAALARALPPDGRTSNYSGYSQLARTGSNDPGYVQITASLLYDDGSGPANVRLSLQGGLGTRFRSGSGSHPDTSDLFSCAWMNGSGGGHFRSCSDSVLPDGTRLLLTEKVLGDALEREVDVLRPDQSSVSLISINTAEVAGQAKVKVVRDGLPLTLDQLKAAALSADLQEWITPEQAQQAEQTIRPFHDGSPEHNQPTGAATPKPGSTG